MLNRLQPKKWDKVEETTNISPSKLTKKTIRFDNGNFCGKGTYTFADGRRYKGEWKDGKRNGQGIYTSPNGSRFEGEYKDDHPDKGTFTFSDGTVSVLNT